jgi:spore germination protein YaaH
VKLPRSFPSASSIAIALSLILGGSILGAPAQADNPPRKIFSGWIPYYSIRTSLPAAINNADLIQEVMPFWYTLKYNGTTKLSVVTDLYKPANPSIPMEQTLTSLRNAGFTIIPTITDGTVENMLASLMAKPASRTQIVKAITDLVISNNFDGIDLDFEGFAFVDSNKTWPKTAPVWTAFVKELSVSLHAQKKLLSVSTPYLFDPTEKSKGYYVYAWAAIAPHIDRLRIMTYDYSVSRPGPIGPLAWAEKTVKYAVSVMPASKVYLGVAGYGRDWVTAVTGVCPSNVASVIKPGAKAATFVMRDSQNLAATYGVVPTYNQQFGEMTFTYQKSYNGTTAGGLSTSCTATRVAWYQDAQGYTARASLVEKYRLGGLAAWTIGMEEPLALEGVRNIAKSIAPDKVIASLTIDTATVNYGRPITLNALLTIKDKSPLMNVAVRIEGKSPGETEWRLLANATTDIEGKISKQILLGKATSVRVYSEGTWERSAGLSNESAVVIKRGLIISAPASVKSGESFQITGSLRPRTPGASLILESLVAGKWIAVGKSVVTDSLGNFSLPVPAQQRGAITLRVTAAADALYPVNTSPQFSVLVRSTLPPKLVK